MSNIGNHAPNHDQVRARLDDDLALTKVHTLLGRRGVVVSYRTLHRYATAELGRNASISSAVLVQAKGFGFSFHVVIQSRMSFSSAGTLV